MIYDCFTFYNELELLDIRLHVLDKVVDKFVLLESPRTYTNLKKPLYYAKNRKLFNKFSKKIIHIIVDDTPNVSHPWIIEHFLMAAAIRGLKKAKPTDIILISNLDEIPNPEKIMEWKDKNGKLKVFEQQFFYYFLNFASTNHKWLGTKMLEFREFRKYLDAYVVRHSPNDTVIEDGGWHFSYMGGIKRVQDKMATGSHQEYNNDNYNTKEKIILSMIQGRDVFGHGDKFEFVKPEVLPTYIQNNKLKFKAMFANPNKKIYLKSQYLRYLHLKHIMRVMYRKFRKTINGLYLSIV